MPDVSQTKPFLEGDLTPHQSDLVDLRNDNAGSPSQQTRGIIVRYLESLPAEGSVDFDSMVADITRHYPFHGDKPEVFREALDELEKGGWVEHKEGTVRLDKVARVARRFLLASVRAPR
jgi:hypothetical protein